MLFPDAHCFWKNFESILKTDKRFAAFLKSPDEIHWEAFKSQVARIGYPENELVHRRYNEYIRNVDHCRRIFFTLKYWELADSGFINRKKGDIGIRIWSWQQRTFFRQIAVENAERNWHSDPSFSSKGDQKKISHPLTAKIDNDFIRMVCIHFQNSSGRTIESQVFKYSILPARRFNLQDWHLRTETGRQPCQSCTRPAQRLDCHDHQRDAKT